MDSLQAVRFGYRLIRVHNLCGISNRTVWINHVRKDYDLVRLIVSESLVTVMMHAQQLRCSGARLAVLITDFQTGEVFMQVLLARYFLGIWPLCPFAYETSV